MASQMSSGAGRWWRRWSRSLTTGSSTSWQAVPALDRVAACLRAKQQRTLQGHLGHQTVRPAWPTEIIGPSPPWLAASATRCAESSPVVLLARPVHGIAGLVR